MCAKQKETDGEPVLAALDIERSCPPRRMEEDPFARDVTTLRRRLSDTLRSAREAVESAHQIVAAARATRAQRGDRALRDAADLAGVGVRRALRESERAIAVRDQFVALVAHEMRQPLQAAAAAAVLFEGDPPPDARARAGAVLRRQIERLSRLVEDLLESSRVAARGVELHMQLVDLGPLMRAVVTDIEHRIEARGHELIVAAPHGPVQFAADGFRVHQVCVNLLENAATYTPNGGRIWFEGSRAGDEIRLIVRDNGPGIPEDVQPSLFDMFTRGCRIGEGIGVGLAIVRELVQLHGGTIRLRSSPGQGAQFTVTLPVRDTVASGSSHGAARVVSAT